MSENQKSVETPEKEQEQVLGGSAFSSFSGSASFPPPPLDIGSSSDSLSAPLQRQEDPVASSNMLVSAVVQELATPSLDIIPVLQQVAGQDPTTWPAFDSEFALQAPHPQTGGSSLLDNIAVAFSGFDNTPYNQVLYVLDEYGTHLGVYDEYFHEESIIPEDGVEQNLPAPGEIFISFDNQDNGSRGLPYVNETIRIELDSAGGEEFELAYPNINFKYLTITHPDGELEVLIAHNSVYMSDTFREFTPEVEGTYTVHGLAGYYDTEGAVNLQGSFLVSSAQADSEFEVEGIDPVDYDQWQEQSDLAYGMAGGQLGEDPSSGENFRVLAPNTVSGSGDGATISITTTGWGMVMDLAWYIMPGSGSYPFDYLSPSEVTDPSIKTRLGFPEAGVLYRIANNHVNMAQREIPLPMGLNRIAVDDPASDNWAAAEVNVMSSDQAENLEEMDEYRDNVAENTGQVDTDSLLPVGAVWVEETSGQSRVLNIYAGPASDNPEHAIVLDLTPGADVMDFRGEGETYAESWGLAFDAFASGNHYPNGHITLSNNGLPAELQLSDERLSIDTNQQTTNEYWMNLAGSASLALFVAGVALATLAVPVAPAVLAASGAAGVVGNVAGIRYELEKEEPNWTTIATNTVGIAGTLFGMGGSALRAISTSPNGTVRFANMSRVGKVFNLASFGLGATEVIVVDVVALQQFATIMESDMTTEQKQQAFGSLFSQLALTNGMFVVDAIGFRNDVQNGEYDEFFGSQGDTDTPSTTTDTSPNAPGTTNGAGDGTSSSNTDGVARLTLLEPFATNYQLRSRLDFVPIEQLQVAQGYTDASLQSFFTGAVTAGDVDRGFSALARVESQAQLNLINSHEKLTHRPTAYDLLNHHLLESPGQLLAILDGPDYANGQALLSVLDSGTNLPPQIDVSTTQVSNSVRDGGYGWTSSYTVTETPGLITISLNIQIVPGTNVTDADISTVQADTLTAFQRYFDQRFTLTDSDGNARPLAVDAVFTDANPNLVVDLQAGNGRDNLSTWHVLSEPITRAHELGHQIGLVDEYYQPNDPHTPTGRATENGADVYTDNSLMGNYFTDDGGQAAADVRLRHGEQIAAEISAATGTTYTVQWNDYYIVRDGDTMEGIALRIYQDEAKADDLRRLNGMGANEQPAVDTQIDLLPTESSETSPPPATNGNTSGNVPI